VGVKKSVKKWVAYGCNFQYRAGGGAWLGKWHTAIALLGGTLAGGTHFTKAGSRALINASPGPFSNWVASFGEEGLFAFGLWLALAHPAAFLVFLVLFIGMVIWLLPKLWRGVKPVLGSVAGLLRRKSA